MRLSPLVLSLGLSLGASVIAGCSGGGSDPPPDADEALACMTSGRGDTYVAGLEKMGTGGQLDFHLVSANPSPPARYLNAWVVQINSMAAGVVGAPMSDASLVVTPYMPDHQHGAGDYKTKVAPMADNPGQYQLTDINTWMPGYWEITIDATAGTVQDTVVYKFCIQE
ncbi:MAG TPA: FixH family protein [Kofleriaceae bacterium]|jgi:hypothetical protein|nr:FixH family protein [Kofleriaceae bacterium]